MIANHPLASMLFVALAGIAMYGNLLAIQIVGEVNRNLPPGKRFSPLFWYPGKMGRVSREYRGMFPDGTQVRALRLVELVFVGLFLFFLYSLGVFS